MNNAGHLPSYYDYLVVGAGPAGLQMGYFLEKEGYSYQILEAHKRTGAFFETYPRSRTLISFNKISSIYDDPEIRLRWDWNSLLNNYEFLFAECSKRLYPKAEELIEYLEGFAARYQLQIKYDTRINSVAKEADGRFHVTDEKGHAYRCRCLIIATGLCKPYIPTDIPGIELVTEGYENVSMRPDDFLGQRVLIIGKGNSGFEIADNILETAALIHLASPRTMRFAWVTRHPGDLRANYANLLDTYQLKLLNGTLHCHINKISRQEDKFVVSVTYIFADGETEELIYDRVIRCTGFQFDDGIFDESCRPALALLDRFPEMTGIWESVNIPNLFFAGTTMQVKDFRKSASAFIDGFRYNIRTLFRYLEARYQGKSLVNYSFAATADSLADAAMQRICRTSALWTQFGYLCDLIVVDEATKTAHYYEELPIDYVKESELGKEPHYYIITFEWGEWQGDVFAIERHPKHETAYTNAFLHPIVRRFACSELLVTHHVLEDLFGMYSYEGGAGILKSRSGREPKQYHTEEHDIPIRHFFAGQIEGVE